MIEQLRNKFKTEKKADTKSDNQSDRCNQCQSERMWQPIGRGDWLCETCEPPSRESFVRDRRGPDIRYVVDECELGCFTPQCEACGCRRTIERAWSDGTVEERCWTCQAAISRPWRGAN